LKDIKSHDWGTNTVTIQGTSTMRTINVIKKLGVQTKRPKVLVCYDFHFGIADEEEDVMFATKLELFSIGTIVVPTHTKSIFKSTCILDISIIEQVPKQHVESVMCFSY
jgi:hypothetical protein